MPPTSSMPRKFTKPWSSCFIVHSVSNCRRLVPRWRARKFWLWKLSWFLNKYKLWVFISKPKSDRHGQNFGHGSGHVCPPISIKDVTMKFLWDSSGFKFLVFLQRKDFFRIGHKFNLWVISIILTFCAFTYYDTFFRSSISFGNSSRYISRPKYFPSRCVLKIESYLV